MTKTEKNKNKNVGIDPIKGAPPPPFYKRALFFFGRAPFFLAPFLWRGPPPKISFGGVSGVCPIFWGFWSPPAQEKAPMALFGFPIWRAPFWKAKGVQIYIPPLKWGFFWVVYRSYEGFLKIDGVFRAIIPHLQL